MPTETTTKFKPYQEQIGRLCDTIGETLNLIHQLEERLAPFTKKQVKTDENPRPTGEHSDAVMMVCVQRDRLLEVNECIGRLLDNLEI